MKKRILASALWLYAGWYAGDVLATTFGLSPFLGPLMGTVAAVLVAGDPFHLLWRSIAPQMSGRLERSAQS